MFARLILRKHIRILTYHRFGEKYVTSELFKKHLTYLRKHFSLIDLKSFLSFLLGNTDLPPNSVIITVDDGYQDFYTVAFPVLKKYAVPATISLTVDFIDKGIWLWHDLLNFGISSTSRLDFTLNGNYYDLRNQRQRCELKVSLDKICTSCSPIERDTFITQILKELDVTLPERPTPEYAPLTWDQVFEMSEHGISYGAHTLTHPILSKMPPDDAFHEIHESRRRIEEIIQRDVVAFCYPNGKEGDFNEAIKEMVRQCGFACAFSTIYGMNDLGTDRFALSRMGLDSRSFIHFLQDVSGFGVLRASLRRLRHKILSPLSGFGNVWNSR